ncbi:hypothetical protein FRB90_006033, partial [Tulasnella sp. 427]
MAPAVVARSFKYWVKDVGLKIETASLYPGAIEVFWTYNKRSPTWMSIAMLKEETSKFIILRTHIAANGDEEWPGTSGEIGIGLDLSPLKNAL